MQDVSKMSHDEVSRANLSEEEWGAWRWQCGRSYQWAYDNLYGSLIPRCDNMYGERTKTEN